MGLPGGEVPAVLRRAWRGVVANERDAISKQRDLSDVPAGDVPLDVEKRKSASLA
jgi:hypothetical protein